MGRALLLTRGPTDAHPFVDDPSVFIVEPGGGLDILTALHLGATKITSISSNPIVADHLRRQFRSNIDSGIVEVLAGNPRSFLSRSSETFDLVIVSLPDSFRPVQAGAFSLTENHVYTSEAFRAYLDHLSADGLLSATRWIQVPPSEEMRMTATVVEVLGDRGGVPADRKISVLRTLQTLTVFARNNDFQTKDLTPIRRFADTRQKDFSYLTGNHAEEFNHEHGAILGSRS